MIKATNRLTDDPVVLKIIDLLQKQGKTAKDMEIALGLKHGTVSKWKYHNIKSYNKVIDAIASYLEVTVYELTEVDDSIKYMDTLSYEEKQIIEVFRQLSPAAKEYFNHTVQFLKNETK